jgi:predicted NUDIX family NTP pyrophosphohydrolase
VAERSAGLLMYRRREGRTEVLLAHPGGPFWAKKDEGAWSIPKGLFEEGEDPLRAARREFTEETGFRAKSKGFVPLGEARQKGGKLVLVWAFEGDARPEKLKSNTFTVEWPPRSGLKQEFPEMDRAEWFDLETAKKKILPGQREFIERLEEKLGV